MAILWCGGEEIDFPVRGANVSMTTSGAVYRVGYSRGALAVGPSGQLSRSTTFAAQTSLWLSVRLYPGGGPSNRGYIGLTNSAATGADGIYLGAGSSLSKAAVFKFNGTTHTEMKSETGTMMTSGVLHKIDLHLVNYGAAGTIDVYVDGNLAFTHTGDLSVAGVASFDQIAILGTGASATDVVLSEVIVADEDTRLLSLVTQYPTATAGGSQWTNDHQAVDELNLSDADTVYTETADNEIKMDTQNIPAGQFIVKAVKDVWRGASGAAGVHTIVPGVVIPGQNGDLPHYGTGKTHTTAWETGERLMNQNPVTTNRWQVSEIDAAQIAFKSGA